ncbi:hypothetical protein TRVL_09176 [Trypanosoma vivax]|nr:hypothetical protein TRVL_09176 [Trypanosoma vivax]
MFPSRIASLRVFCDVRLSSFIVPHRLCRCCASLQRPDFSSRISSLLDSFTESRELISEALESVGTVYAAEDMEDARLQTEKTLMLWAELLKDLQESGDFAAVSRIEKEYGLKFAQLKEELENAEQAVGE